MRQPISKQHYITVFKRDAWSCRYCSEGVFFTPSLKILNTLNPGHGYYHPNGKTGAVLNVFQWKWATVDHVIPVSHGGKNSLENYVTACWRCNLTLNDKYETKEKAQLLNAINKDMGWDGFSGLYLKLGPQDAWYRLLSLSDEDLHKLNIVSADT